MSIKKSLVPAPGLLDVGGMRRSAFARRRSPDREEVYIKEYQSVLDAVSNLRAYSMFYNQERLYQALDYQTPAQIYTSR